MADECDRVLINGRQLGVGNVSSTDDFSRLEKQVLDLTPRVLNAALQVGMQDAIGRLDVAERRVRDAPITLVVMGEFNRGKSSLLNALLEDPELFPVDSYVSTRVLTSARWGPAETITVTLAASGDRPHEERHVSRADLRSYVCEAAVQDGAGAEDADRVTAVSIVIPNAKLRNGLVVVDTPGIGGVHRGHTAVALGVLAQSDVVLYVTDAGQPLMPSELVFVADVAKTVEAGRYPERLLFAITKIDQVRDPDVKVGDVRSRVAALPGLGDRCVVLPVSSRHRLLHLTGGDPEDYELSGFEAFEAQLWHGVARACLRLKAGAALAELDVAVQSLLAPVEEALAVLAAKDAEARAALSVDAEARQAEAAKLADGAATWPEDLRAALAKVTATLQAEATAGLAEIWRAVRVKYRTDDACLDDPQLALDDLTRGLALMVGTLGEGAATRVSAACDELAARSGLRLSSPEMGALPVPSVPEAAAEPLAQGAPTVADNIATAFDAAVQGARIGAERGGQVGEIAWSQALRQSLPGGRVIVMTGQAIEKVTGYATPVQTPGAAAGRLAGALVGATLAFIGQIRAIRGMSRADRVAALDQLFAPWEEQQRTFVHEAIQDLLDAYSEAAETNLRSRIEQRRAECGAAVSEISAALAAHEHDSASATDALSARRETLTELRREVTNLANEVRALLGEEER